MNILLVVGIGAVLLLVASRTYPFWIARVFRLDDRGRPPSEQFADGQDYVKTPTQVVFAHHFASIAGAGPIVGPIIALAFGWGWSWLWIIVGGILYGAVHDMSAMCVSLREGGKTIAEIARRTLGNFGYFLFVAFLLLVISLVNAIFLKLSAGALSSMYPLEALGLDADQTLLRTTAKDGVTYGIIGGIATTSVIVMTLFAPVLGSLITKRGMRGLPIFLLATGVCLASVVVGFHVPVAIEPGTWMIILAAYVFVACWIPVWLVLQPRDFMNVQILYGGMLLLVAATIAGGIAGDGMQMAISSVRDGTASRGPFWPIMFITIACGAISGFHSLVATGTTIKQIPRETDCRRIGYQAMLLESFLALLVLTAVASQMDHAGYVANMTSGGKAIQTFAVGCGSMFTHLGIPMAIGCVLGILVIEGFLVTTLDTAIRLARYLVEELWGCLWSSRDGEPPAVLRNPLFNTGCAVGMMLLFAYSERMYDALWPFFGAGNQLIGALALTTVSIWLLKRRRPVWFTAIPAVFMVVTAVAALGWLVRREWGKEGDLRLVIVGAGSLLLALSVGFVLVAVWRVRGALREAVAD
ncbi:MAG: carbon starvation CstA family protein [Planctomycetota bacterium]|jgi:carbon starvation protein